jgi:hypothetical protein
MTDFEIPDASPETTTALTIIEPAPALPVPVLIAAAGERASLRFVDFFTAHIRNPNTRAAYGVAVRSLFTWLEMQGVAELAEIRTHQSPRGSRLGSLARSRWTPNSSSQRTRRWRELDSNFPYAGAMNLVFAPLVSRSIVRVLPEANPARPGID